MSFNKQEVAVLIGTGSIGRTLLIADYGQENLDRAKESFLDDGYRVETQLVDVSKRERLPPSPSVLRS